MSETIASITGLDFRKDTKDRYYWFDTQDNKRISEDVALNLLNSSDDDRRQDPVMAIWHNEGNDLPVTIDGFVGRDGDEDYLHAQGSTTGIPRSQLEFIGDMTPVQETHYDELIKLREEVADLSKINQELGVSLAGLEARLVELDALRQENQRLEAENALLTERVAKLQEALQSREELQPEKSKLDEELETEFGSNWVPREGSTVNLREDSGYLSEGWEVTTDPHRDAEGYWVVSIKNGDETREEWIGDLSRSRLVIPSETVVMPPEVVAIQQPEDRLESRHRNRLRRLSGLVGGFVVGRQVRLHNGVYNLVDRRGNNPEIIDEETAVVYEEDNERVGAAAVGGAAVGAVAGIALWELFEHKVFGHSSGPKVINHTQTVTLPGKTVHEGAGSVFGIPGPNSSGRHTDFFNAAPGHRKTGADLPKPVHLKKIFGHATLVDDNGRTIVGRLKDGLFDRQGNLSQRARAIARAKGYLLTQGKLGSRFMSYIWTR